MGDHRDSEAGLDNFDGFRVRILAAEEAGVAGCAVQVEHVLLGVLLACPELIAALPVGAVDGARAREVVRAIVLERSSAAEDASGAQEVREVWRRAFELAGRRGAEPSIADVGRAVLEIASDAAERVVLALGFSLPTLRVALGAGDGAIEQPRFESRLPPIGTRSGRLVRSELSALFRWVQAVRVYDRPDASEPAYVRGSLDAMRAHSLLSTYEHQAWLVRLTNELGPQAERAHRDVASSWPRLDTYELPGSQPAVHEHLRRLLQFAERAGAASGGDPSRTVTTRSYIGGILTTLDHLELISYNERCDWSERLEEPLPPVPKVIFQGGR
jgi:hypothetical protein